MLYLGPSDLQEGTVHTETLKFDLPPGVKIKNKVEDYTVRFTVAKVRQ